MRYLCSILLLGLLLAVCGQGPRQREGITIQCHGDDCPLTLEKIRAVLGTRPMDNHVYRPGVKVVLESGWETVAKVRGLELDGDKRPPTLTALPPQPREIVFRPMKETKVVEIPGMEEPVLVWRKRNGQARPLMPDDDYWKVGNEIRFHEALDIGDVVRVVGW